MAARGPCGTLNGRWPTLSLPAPGLLVDDDVGEHDNCRDLPAPEKDLKTDSGTEG